MSSLVNLESQAEFSIHPGTAIDSVSLTVADLDRQIVFYQQVLGFELLWRDGNQAGLGAGEHELLNLVEQPGNKHFLGFYLS